MQETIIDAVLRGQDVLALMPTGGGKSLCFQVPALLMDGLCIVISPLIALMKDQVEALRNRGINALSVHAGMPYREVKETFKKAAFGDVKFLYLSPERLETALFDEYLPALKPILIAVDEAHCISQWGYDFRPPYARISGTRKKIPGVPIIALTASATPVVQQDICEKLDFGKNAKIFRQSFVRSNLSYSVYMPEAKETRVVEILKKVAGPGIVYCKSRKHTQQVASLLRLHGISANYYHAGLTHEERNSRQNAWLNNNTRVIVCTNAFGMGIDKPDVGIIIHFDVPDCLENYYQEAGRAGRNGKKAYAVLLYEEPELKVSEAQVPVKYPDAAVVKEIYTHLMNYLQVPAGSGELISYQLDLPVFSQRFGINILSAMYGLQALSMSGLITYDEGIFKPSTVVFTCTKSDLEEFEKMQPRLVYVIKGLLRSYESIFDYPSTIYEGLLASFLQTEVNTIKTSLAELSRLQVISYQPSSSKPQVQLLQNRMYQDDFKIDQQSISYRRQRATERLKKMHDYIHEVKKCRSKFLGQYFGDEEMGNCGICDVCLEQKKSAMISREVEDICEEVLEKLNKCVGKIGSLEHLGLSHSKSSLHLAIDYLVGEEIIGYNKEGELEIKKKGPR